MEKRRGLRHFIVHLTKRNLGGARRAEGQNPFSSWGRAGRRGPSAWRCVELSNGLNDWSLPQFWCACIAVVNQKILTCVPGVPCRRSSTTGASTLGFSAGGSGRNQRPVALCEMEASTHHGLKRRGGVWPIVCVDWGGPSTHNENAGTLCP